ncbi:MAG: sugar kinase [Chloroflexi bacterium]|nr:sugar kinase [Chloroflexota bacterium]
MRRPVVVLGDANVDLLIDTPAEISGPVKPRIAPPQLHGGGTGANTAVGLARLEVPVTFVGVVGDDGYGRMICADLAQDGIDTSALVVRPDVFTPMVLALVYPNGERLLAIWPPDGGAPTHLRPEDIPVDVIRNAGWLHTTGISLRWRPVREAALYAMQIAHEAGVPVSLDLNLRLELWGWENDMRITLDRALPLTDILFGSGPEEIVPLADVDSVPEAAQHLAGGKRTVVARMGPQGALVALPDGVAQQVSGFAVDVVDTLGAGDAFDSGFIAARVAGYDALEAARWGNATAALKITRQGARAVPSRAEVMQLLGRP